MSVTLISDHHHLLDIDKQTWKIHNQNKYLVFSLHLDYKVSLRKLRETLKRSERHIGDLRQNRALRLG